LATELTSVPKPSIELESMAANNKKNALFVPRTDLQEDKDAVTPVGASPKLERGSGSLIESMRITFPYDFFRVFIG